MPVTHSNFNNLEVQNVCNLPILPLKTKAKGPAPPAQEGEDIIDEALNCFKANVFFRNFEVKGAADRLLIYITLYISQALLKMPNQNKINAEKALFQLAIENFALPGDKNFALGGIVTNPASRAETDLIRQYLTQIRQETGLRLLAKVYANGDAAPDKWWMCFNKRKFLNKQL
eukprot:TRINITY_DN11367_c0_g1_i1.p1 TRINITY_DN11367_c0_g1~~TRINITY_DN11367_c0_g1_i1.p1  ORF type:complete len:173 (+),score=51.68 TRINITY_DN11367_c0_g1_i1:116-634(+)